MSQAGRTAAALAWMFVLAAGLGFAGGEPEEVASAAEPEPIAVTEDPIALERMTVTGQRSRAAIRRELFATQTRVYELFNEQNEEDDYDMVCRLEARIGSQIRYRVCKPRFWRKAEAEASRELMAGLEDGAVYQLNQPELRRQTERQRELMAELANHNPEFLDLLKQRLALWRAYQELGSEQ